MSITLSTDGYCQLTDVQALIQQFTIGSSTDPSTTEVEGWITEDFAELNALLRSSGYAAPVAQAAGSLTAGGGTIVTKEDVEEGNHYVTVQGSGGTLVGMARRGDFFLIGTDAQRYMIVQDAHTNDDGEAALLFVPDLELDVVAGATITFIAGTDAAKVLKKLNALMTVIRVIPAAYSTQGGGVGGEGDVMVAYQRERDAIMKRIEKNLYDFPSAVVESVSDAPMINLIRA